MTCNIEGCTQEATHAVDFIRDGEPGRMYVCDDHFRDIAQSMMDSLRAPALGGLTDLAAALMGRAGEPKEPSAPGAQPGTKAATTERAQDADPFGDMAVNLTALAAEGKLKPVIGRQREIERALRILGRKEKNNPVLLGDPGVGKTAIVEGIAQLIALGKVPPLLQGAQIYALNMGRLVAGTKYRGEFEARLEKMLGTLEHSPKSILFIDEIHLLVGAGAGEGAMDAGNLLKPSLARGTIKLIGATTFDEYRKFIEKDSALERRLQPVHVVEPSAEETTRILLGVKGDYEKHHGIRVPDELLPQITRLCERYVTSHRFPDKALDVLDEACALAVAMAADEGKGQEAAELSRRIDAAVAAERYEDAAQLKRRRDSLLEAHSAGSGELTLGAQHIAKVVEEVSGVPAQDLQEDERQRLLDLEARLHEQVIGQDAAVTALAQAVRRRMTSQEIRRRPIGSFLFLGPTGVGKTELAKTLARVLFGSEQALIRVDMSEYMEKHALSRLIGAPPGYVGYEEAGQLSEQVRRHPYSVILLDEIEKAHPDVLHLFLQVLDDGRITDGQGRTVDFCNTIVVMTSNMGGAELRKRSIGFGATDAAERLETVLQGNLPPEFRNRIDDVVLFRSLTGQELERILELQLREVAAGYPQIRLEFSDALRQELLRQGCDERFGARPLRRAVERTIQNHLADLLLRGACPTELTLDWQDGRVVDRGLAVA